MRIFVFIALITFFYSCKNSTVYDEFQPVPDNKWEEKNAATFNVNINDTVSLHKLYINLRCNESYSYNNLFLFIKVYYPNNMVFADTVECVLVDPNGKWLGNGFGSLYTYQMPYRSNFIFPFKGDYKFEFTQGMRAPKGILEGITDVGIKIEEQQLEK